MTCNVDQWIREAGALTVGELLSDQARIVPDRIALDDGTRRMSYAVLNERVNRLAHCLTALGVARGDRVAILSENRHEYIEASFAAAKLGAILCALNWRLAPAELAHCVTLVDTPVVLVSARFESALRALSLPIPTIIVLGPDYEERLAGATCHEPERIAQPEDGLLILYTSGTTGLPKGALISHRAELARMAVSRIDAGLQAGDGFAAWAPMFHMVCLEHAIHVLGLGGTVFIVDGADIDRLVHLIATEPQWWLVLIPGMIEPLLIALREQGVRPKQIRIVGALADLVSPQMIAETSERLQAPYWNTFGSTETGMLPAAGSRFGIGEVPDNLDKAHNSLYRSRLVDPDDRDVPVGEAGEITVRGPTVFSGYWRADAVNETDFRGGWFHMGDMFIEQPDGRLRFVDRAKYLIKSGGENIYPSEIERVLMSDPRVAEAVVVKRRDDRWGEVPVAFVVLQTPGTLVEDLMRFCRANLSSYKLPREIRFVSSGDDFPRSTSGKVQRQVLERWLDALNGTAPKT